MKTRFSRTLRLLNALIATAFLIVGFNQAAARIDPVVQHKAPALDGTDQGVSQLPCVWCAQD
jgi:hypothetical protein